MKKFLILLILSVVLQSCIITVKKDYNGYSKTLVFSKDKKWLTNNIQTILDSRLKDKVNKEMFSFFDTMSDGNATSISEVKSNNLISGKIPIEVVQEDLESLKSATDFDFLVNVYTYKLRQDLDHTIGVQEQYKKNETYAIMDVYDIKSMRKIYSCKAYSEFSIEKGEKATIFTPTTEMMTMKDINSLIGKKERHQKLENAPSIYYILLLI